MSKINLLPWREAENKLNKQKFVVGTGLGFVGVFVLMLCVNFVVMNWIERQQQRNAMLLNEIQTLDIQLGKIKELRKRKGKLQERIDLVQSLQRSRNTPTRLMNTLPQLVPIGVNLSKLTFKNDIVTINGISESNTRLAVLLRNIEDSEWLTDGSLDSIVALLSNRGNRFEMRLRVNSTVITEEGL